MLCSGLVMTGLVAFTESVLKRKEKIKKCQPTVPKLWYLFQIPATTFLTLMKVVHQRVADVGSLIMTSLQIHCRSCRFDTRGVVSAMLLDSWHHDYSVSFPLTYFHLDISQMWCWSGGIRILIKLCLLQYLAIVINWVLSTITMVHKDTSTSYSSYCIGLCYCSV